jgi:hypothetical protein
MEITYVPQSPRLDEAVVPCSTFLIEMASDGLVIYPCQLSAWLHLLAKHVCWGVCSLVYCYEL